MRSNKVPTFLDGSPRLNCMVNKLPTRYLHFQMGLFSLALRSAKSFVHGPLQLSYMHSKVPSFLDGSMHLGCAVNKAHTFSDASPWCFSKNICDVTQQFPLHFFTFTDKVTPPHIYNLPPSTKHRHSDTTKQNPIYIITDTAKHKLTPPHIYNLHRLQNIDRRQSNIIT